MFRGVKTGRCTTGAQRDAGTVVHWVDGDPERLARSGSWDRALCGTGPGRTSAGWSEPYPSDREVTCKRCLKAAGRSS